MKILIGCEFSQVVTQAFRLKGHDAFSCDILPGEINSKWHYQEDIIPLLAEKWDMICAFPPCTHLSKAGAHLWKQKQANGLQQDAFEFVKLIWNANSPKICIENPIGWLNTNWMKPIQIVEPYWFGHIFKKATCLWLKNLPKLIPTNLVTPTRSWVNSSSNYRPGCKMSNKGMHRNQKTRSKTFQGLADAMANQWG